MSDASASGLSGLEAGMIFQALQDVALGPRLVADGEIRQSAKTEFLSLLRTSGARGVFVTLTNRSDTARLVWRASRFAWCLIALDWLENFQAESAHLHWIQGLLYGYSPGAIEDYLVRISGLTANSQTYSPWHTGEMSPLSRGGLSACCTKCIDKHRTLSTCHQSTASEILLSEVKGTVYLIDASA